MIAANGMLLLAEQEKKIGNKSGAALYQNTAMDVCHLVMSMVLADAWSCS